MSAKYLRILVAVLAFCAGIGLVYGLRAKSQLEDYLVRNLSPQLEGEQFVSLAAFCGPEFNSHQYLILETGETLEQSGEVFRSASAAQRALEQKLARASRVVERTGNSEGERVVAVYSTSVSIFRIEGAVIAAINAPSLTMAREFESWSERSSTGAVQHALGADSP